MQLTVSIAEMKVSEKRDDVLVTYSLGSCVGVSLYDPEAELGGLIHCMLPLAEIDSEYAKENPCMFADAGVALLVKTLVDMGAVKERLEARMAGAAKLIDNTNTFVVGDRNRVVVREVLKREGIPLAAADTGGSFARTLKLYMDTGRTEIKSGGRVYDLT